MIDQSRYAKVKSALGRLAGRGAAVLGLTGLALSAVTAAEYAADSETPAQALGGYFMTEAEKDWCAWPSRWRICSMAGVLSERASNDAYSEGKERGWSDANGGGDALRHCSWNGYLTKAFGAETAERIATLHEYDPRQSDEEKEMDLFNNAKGREWATAEKVYDRCIQGVENGELRTIVE